MAMKSTLKSIEFKLHHYVEESGITTGIKNRCSYIKLTLRLY